MAISKTKAAQIRGITHMNHRIRTILDISCAEYCVLDFIYSMNLKAKHFSEEKNGEDMFKFLGLYPVDLQKVVDGLLKKELLTRDCGNLITTMKWDNHFGAQFAVEYAVLWTKYGPKGNRKKGLEMYTKARMEGISYEHLAKRVDIYINYLDSGNKHEFKMHLSTFFNPQYKQYDNEEFNEDSDKYPAKSQLNFSL